MAEEIKEEVRTIKFGQPDQKKQYSYTPNLNFFKKFISGTYFTAHIKINEITFLIFTHILHAFTW